MAKVKVQDLLPILNTALCGQESAAMATLKGGLEPDQLYRDASEHLDRECSQSPFKPQWECASGCSACCHQMVAITPLEAIQMANYAREHFSDEQQEEVLARLRDNAAHYADSSTSDGRSVACALLDEASGNCRVQPVKPLRCQGWYSRSRARCEAAHQGEAVSIPTDPYAASSTRGIQSGLATALRRHGLDGNYYELHSAVLRAWESTAEDRWAKGEDLFSACTSTPAVPDVLWILGRGDGSFIKVCRVDDADGNPSLSTIVENPSIAWQFNVTM